MNVFGRLLPLALIVLTSTPVFAQRMRAGDSLPKDKVAAWRGDAQVSGKIVDDAGKLVCISRCTLAIVPRN